MIVAARVDAEVAVLHAKGGMKSVNLSYREYRLAAVARRWEDELRDALVESHGEADGLALERRWSSAFPVAYREHVTVRASVHDIRKLESLTAEQTAGPSSSSSTRSSW